MKKFILPICVLSLLIIKSVAPSLFLNQLFWMIGGLIVFFLFSKANYKDFVVLWWIIYLTMIFLLVLVFLQPEIRGAHRWISLFVTRIQPSEIAKPLIVFCAASFLSFFPKLNFKKIFFFSLLFLLPVILILKQPDLGNAIVFMFIFLILLLSSRFKVQYLFFGIILFLILSPFFWNHLAPYQKTRITSFVMPQYDVKGAGYNAYQALIAIGSGGFWGLGLGQGKQSHLRFLPEQHTDFIYSSLVEELGLLGGMILLFLYLGLLFKIASIIINSENDFSRYFLIGVFSQIFIQIFINVGMNLGIMPITGITLPLFSFGGSSILSTFISLGICASLTRENKELIAIG